MQVDPLHAAHLAQVLGALLALLREAGADMEPNDMPTTISVNLDAAGMTVTYSRHGVAVGEEFI